MGGTFKRLERETLIDVSPEGLFGSFSVPPRISSGLTTTPIGVPLGSF